MTMKKLIYRELYLSKKSMRMTLGIGAMIFLLGALVLLSCRFGNLAKYNEPDEVKEMLDSVSAGLPVMIYSILMVAGIDAIPNQILSDHLCGWHKFIKSSEVKAKDYVGAKYAAILILLGASTLLMLLLYPAFLLLSGTAQQISLSWMIVALDFAVFFTDFNIPLLLWAKKREKALFWSVVPVLFLILLSPVPLVLIGTGVLTEEKIGELIIKFTRGGFVPELCISFAILAALMYVSYKLSVHFVEVEG